LLNILNIKIYLKFYLLNNIRENKLKIFNLAY
jgi:hypothetical protein